MPPSASSNRPARSRSAPVNGPAGVAEELALVQLARHRRAVHLDQRPCRSAAPPVHLAGDQLLARAALAEDEDGRVGRRHQVDLPGDRLQRRAAADQLAEGPGPRHLLAQVLVLQLEPPRQLLDPLERPGGGDGGGGVVGDGPQPVHAVRPDRPAGEDGQHPQHLAAMDQRLAAEPGHPLGPHPVRARRPSRAGRAAGRGPRSARPSPRSARPSAPRAGSGGTPRPAGSTRPSGRRPTGRRWRPGAGRPSGPGTRPPSGSRCSPRTAAPARSGPGRRAGTRPAGRRPGGADPAARAPGPCPGAASWDRRRAGVVGAEVMDRLTRFRYRLTKNRRLTKCRKPVRASA